ncbi:MAG TPA: APC family permease [Candidatus Nitrosopolaris sp.]|nr:APC family permease [Candidatus Nitrosopolaris sp.]
MGELGKENEQQQHQLKRSISLFQAIMYGTGLILGAGIYVIIGDVAGIAGNAMWISFIIAAIIALLTGFSYAELSSIFPRSAAEYIFAKNVFGSNFIASTIGCLTIFVAIVSAATVAIGFSQYLAIFLPQFPTVLAAIAIISILSAVSFYGISESLRISTIFTFVEIAGLIIIIIAGFWFSSITSVNYYEMPTKNNISTHIAALGAILSSAGLIFFAYFGFENIVNIADETKNPTKTIPKALLISIIATTIIYVLVALSTSALVGWKELSLSEAPLALAAEKAFGNHGVIMLSLIALFATSNTSLMMLISASRIIYGMSRNRGGDDNNTPFQSSSVFPSSLARVHHLQRTPWIAIITTMLFAMLTVGFSLGDISGIANISVFGIFLVYASVNLCLIWFRFKKPSVKRPFLSPLNIGKFPILSMIGLLTSVIMLFQFNFEIIKGGFLVLLAITILSLILSKNKNILGIFHRSKNSNK